MPSLKQPPNMITPRSRGCCQGQGCSCLCSEWDLEVAPRCAFRGGGGIFNAPWGLSFLPEITRYERITFPTFIPEFSVRIKSRFRIHLDKGGEKIRVLASQQVRFFVFSFLNKKWRDFFFSFPSKKKNHRQILKKCLSPPNFSF